MEPDDELLDESLDLDSSADTEDIAAYLLERLEDGPRSLEDLGRDLVDAGLLQDHEMPVEQADEVLSLTDATWLRRDGMVVLASTITATGMTFTHRLLADEIEAGTVALAPDLTVLDWDAADGLDLDGGGHVKVDFGGLNEPIRLAGPPGWLDGFKEGDLVAFRRTADQVSLAGVDDPADSSAEVQALRDAAGAWIGDGNGEEEVPFLMEAMAKDPTLFRKPVLPVGELLVEAGMERRGFEWGWVDQEWQTSKERYAEARLGRLSRRYGLETCCEKALDRVQEGWRAFVADEEVEALPVADALGHGDVARAFADLHSDSPEQATRFGRLVAQGAAGPRRAAGLALAGVCELVEGQALDAEQTLIEALDVDPDCFLAAGELATLMADRGDVVGALTLARRDELNEGQIEWLTEEKDRRAALRPKVGRNDRCPCGSGRKYKVCCAQDPSLRLVERMPFVVKRVTSFAASPLHRESRFDLISAAVTEGQRDDEDQASAIRRFADDLFLVEAVTFEGGLGSRYMAERGPLLPADERSLLAAMLEQSQRLWQVDDLDEGSALTLRDVHSDETIQVKEELGSQGRAVGDLLLARVVQVEGGWRMFGSPVLVPEEHREITEATIEMLTDATVLARWYGMVSVP